MRLHQRWRRVADRQRNRAGNTEIPSWLVDLFTEQAQAAGAADPEALAAQLILLYDGAAVGTRMDGPAAARPAARQAAELLVDAATKLPRRARAN